MARKFTSKSKPIQKKTAQPKQVAQSVQEENPKTEVPAEDQVTKPAEANEKSDPETTAVPSVDPDASLEIEKQEDVEESVPQVNTNDELKIEKETGFLKEEPSKQDQNQPLIEEITTEQINKKNYKLFIFGLLLATTIAALSIGYFFLSAKKDTPLTTTTPSPTTEKTQEIKSSYDRSDWSVEVLNGSTKAGAASKLAQSLESLGYKITKTGNADNKDYKNSTVSLGSEMEKYKEDFLKDLDGQITIPAQTETLKDSTASARIIIGQDE